MAEPPETGGSVFCPELVDPGTRLTAGWTGQAQRLMNQTASQFVMNWAPGAMYLRVR